ncbi:MAG: hypothetical protein LBG59_08195 [Candidatus Peribacteria bacterium]|nr:hypothetical protein [Candidatus Peribacteria bacterium]
MPNELTDPNNSQKKIVQNVHYKIEYLPNGNIKVSSEYRSETGDEKGSWESKGYSREMDYNNFLIFIATKHLKPKTESQQKEEQNNNKELLKDNKIPLSKK